MSFSQIWSLLEVSNQIFYSLYIELSSENGPQEIDPLKMKESMDTMTATMLLPISFFVYCRKILGHIVLEK